MVTQIPETFAGCVTMVTQIPETFARFAGV